MINLSFPIGQEKEGLILPDDTDILTMPHPKSISDPLKQVLESINNPINSLILENIIKSKDKSPEFLTSCIVISDSTRPVPYTGDSGILWPLVDKLLKSGLKPENILILVATGTHRGQTLEELKNMLDSRIFSLPIRVENHDCLNNEKLSFLGKTSRGSDILINSDYVNSDVKILTGLVESHFMAGASGGRKSICPGLIGEKSTFIFHGAPMLDDERSCALNLEGNPCHEESLDMARVAGADFIVNVTLDGNFDLTGIFAGELEETHKAAVAHLKSYTAIKVTKKYDIVVTHAGFVGINHYQAAKAGVEAARIVKEGGYILMAADNTDTDPVGSLAYRTMLQLLKLTGSDAFDKTILSPDWTFIPDQWQVQMWNRMFKVIPLDHFYYYSPQFDEQEYRICPGEKLTELSRLEKGSLPDHLSKAIETLRKKLGREPSICWMADGPYGVPLYED